MDSLCWKNYKILSVILKERIDSEEREKEKEMEKKERDMRESRWIATE
jgi:hypothetical protein